MDSLFVPWSSVLILVTIPLILRAAQTETYRTANQQSKTSPDSSVSISKSYFDFHLYQQNQHSISINWLHFNQHNVTSSISSGSYVVNSFSTLEILIQQANNMTLKIQCYQHQNKITLCKWQYKDLGGFSFDFVSVEWNAFTRSNYEDYDFTRTNNYKNYDDTRKNTYGTTSSNKRMITTRSNLYLLRFNLYLSRSDNFIRWGEQVVYKSHQVWHVLLGLIIENKSKEISKDTFEIESSIPQPQKLSSKYINKNLTKTKNRTENGRQKNKVNSILRDSFENKRKKKKKELFKKMTKVTKEDDTKRVDNSIRNKTYQFLRNLSNRNDSIRNKTYQFLRNLSNRNNSIRNTTDHFLRNLSKKNDSIRNLSKKNDTFRTKRQLAEPVRMSPQMMCEINIFCQLFQWGSSRRPSVYSPLYPSNGQTIHQQSLYPSNGQTIHQQSLYPSNGQKMHQQQLNTIWRFVTPYFRYNPFNSHWSTAGANPNSIQGSTALPAWSMFLPQLSGQYPSYPGGNYGQGQQFGYGSVINGQNIGSSQTGSNPGGGTGGTQITGQSRPPSGGQTSVSSAAGQTSISSASGQTSATSGSAGQTSISSTGQNTARPSSGSQTNSMMTTTQRSYQTTMPLSGNTMTTTCKPGKTTLRPAGTDRVEAQASGTSGANKPGMTGIAGTANKPGITGISGTANNPGMTGISGGANNPGITGISGGANNPGITGIAGAMSNAMANIGGTISNVTNKWASQSTGAGANSEERNLTNEWLTSGLNMLKEKWNMFNSKNKPNGNGQAGQTSGQTSSSQGQIGVSGARPGQVSLTGASGQEWWQRPQHDSEVFVNNNNAGNNNGYYGNGNRFPSNGNNFPGNGNNFPGNGNNFPGNANNFPGNANNFPSNTNNFPGNGNNFHSNGGYNFPSNVGNLGNQFPYNPVHGIQPVFLTDLFYLPNQFNLTRNRGLAPLWWNMSQYEPGFGEGLFLSTSNRPSVDTTRVYRGH